MTVHTVQPWAVQPGDLLIGRPGTVDHISLHNGFWQYLDQHGQRIGSCSHFTRIQIMRPTTAANG